MAQVHSQLWQVAGELALLQAVCEVVSPHRWGKYVCSCDFLQCCLLGGESHSPKVDIGTAGVAGLEAGMGEWGRFGCL